MTAVFFMRKNLLSLNKDSSQYSFNGYILCLKGRTYE